MPRVVDHQLDQLFGDLPAVSIEGANGVGKTETAVRRVASEIRLDDDDEVTLLAADRGRIEQLPSPLLIDEWQRYPPVWDAVRRSVDRDPAPGRFLLTGSASPKKSPTHSGAARIVRLHMRPMSLAERGLVEPTVSLADMLAARRPAVTGDSPIDLEAYAHEICRSGFPGIRRFGDPARHDALDGYIGLLIEHDFPEQGHPVRRPETLSRWLTAYAAATATTAGYNTILDAATAGDGDKPAKTTTIGYRDVLTRLRVLEPLPAWLPTRVHLTRLAQAPKHYLCDPALAAQLLGAGPEALLHPGDVGPPVPRDGPLLGALFESLVALNVRVYAQLARARVQHLRTQGGDREVDLVVQRPDGKIVALEVKLGGSVDDADTKHLKWLGDKLGPDLLDAAVVTTGKAAYRRPDGIAVIPAALLGP